MGNINIDPSPDFTADPVIGDENKDENSSNVDILHNNEEEEEAVKLSPAPAKKTKPAITWNYISPPTTYDAENRTNVSPTTIAGIFLDYTIIFRLTMSHSLESELADR